MDVEGLVVAATTWGQSRTEVLEHVMTVELRSRCLRRADGQVLAERNSENWQSRRGWHARLSIAGQVLLRFEAPAYQYQWERSLARVEIVGGAIWSAERELIAFYDAATDRWRDADNQQWVALHFAAAIVADRVELRADSAAAAVAAPAPRAMDRSVQ